MLGLDHGLDVLFRGLANIHEDQIGAWNHQRAELTIVQAEDIAYHLVLMLLDNPRLRALFQHGVDLLLGDTRVARLADTQDAQNGVRRPRQQ